MSDFDDIRKRWAAAAPGPWRVHEGSLTSWWIRYDTDRDCNIPICHFGANHPPSVQRANATAIAHAPEDVARLLAEVERLTRERDAARRGATDLGCSAVEAQREMEGEVERIEAAALLVDGVIWTLPRPARHSHLLHALHSVNRNQPPLAQPIAQGFVTSAGRFVGRTEAETIARACGQKVGPNIGGPLTSEDLW